MNQTSLEFGPEGTALRLVMMPQPLPLLREALKDLGRTIQRKENNLTRAVQAMTACLRTAVFLVIASCFVPSNELWIALVIKIFGIGISVIFVGLTGVISVLTMKCDSYRRDLSLVMLKIGMEEDRATRVRNEVAESARVLECNRALEEDIERLRTEIKEIAASRMSCMQPVLKESHSASNWSSEAWPGSGINQNPLETDKSIQNSKIGEGKKFPKNGVVVNNDHHPDDAFEMNSPVREDGVKSSTRHVGECGFETPKNENFRCRGQISFWNSKKYPISEDIDRWRRGLVTEESRNLLTNVSCLSEDVSKDAVDMLSEPRYCDLEMEGRTMEMAKIRSGRYGCILNSPVSSGGVQDTGFFTPTRGTKPYTPRSRGSILNPMSTHSSSSRCFEHLTPKRVFGDSSKNTHSRLSVEVDSQPTEASNKIQEKQEHSERFKCIVSLSPLPPGSPHHIFDSLNGRPSMRKLIHNSKL